ncbi:MAG: MYXO-CTERM sorting domain-containing protein [Phycisphaerales bacterium]
MSASALLAQAPSSAQQWEVRFVVDSSGAFAQGPNATAVGITMEARVTILPNGSASGTANLGISRVGGSGTATSGFRITFTDALSAGAGLNQGSVEQGATGQAFNDTNGNPITGHFSAFRGSFSPQSFPQFMGSNTDPGNGIAVNPATGSPILTNLVGSRQFNFGSDGSGPVGAGEFTPIYRMIFFPREVLTADGIRNITVAVTGMSARYVYGLQGTNAQTGSTVNLPGVNFSFQVPAPGAAAVAGLGVLALGRRRRA